MTAILRYKHDRAGNEGEMRVSITVDGHHGAIGPNGVGSARQLPAGIIDPNGWLTLPDFGDYPLAMARAGLDAQPSLHRMTIRQGSVTVATIDFTPILDTPESTELNLNDLLLRGAARAVTPEQLRNLEQMGVSASTAAQAANEAAALAQAAAERAATIAGTLEATGVFYFGSTEDGFAVVDTAEPAATLTYEQLDWGIGVMETPVLNTTPGGI